MNNVVLVGDSQCVKKSLGWLEKSRYIFNISTLALLDIDTCDKSQFEEFQLTGVTDVDPEAMGDNLIIVLALTIWNDNIARLIQLKCRNLDVNIITYGRLDIFLEKKDKMLFLEENNYNNYIANYCTNQMDIGVFTYGIPTVKTWREEEHLTIGKFCSIAENVSIFLGGGTQK